MANELESRVISLESNIKGVRDAYREPDEDRQRLEDVAGDAKKSGKDNGDALDMVAKRVITLEKRVEALEKAAAKRK